MARSRTAFAVRPQGKASLACHRHSAPIISLLLISEALRVPVKRLLRYNTNPLIPKPAMNKQGSNPDVDEDLLRRGDLESRPWPHYCHQVQNLSFVVSPVIDHCR